MIKNSQDAAAARTVSGEMLKRGAALHAKRDVSGGAASAQDASAQALEGARVDASSRDAGHAGWGLVDRGHLDSGDVNTGDVGVTDVGLEQSAGALEVVGLRLEPVARVSSLQHHAVIAQATGVLIASHRVSAQQAEGLLLHEASRRGMVVLEVARSLVVDPAAAHEVPWAVCSVCRAVGVLRIFGDIGQVRVWACPQGHGVIRRA